MMSLDDVMSDGEKDADTSTIPTSSTTNFEPVSTETSLVQKTFSRSAARLKAQSFNTTASRVMSLVNRGAVASVVESDPLALDVSHGESEHDVDTSRDEGEPGVHSPEWDDPSSAHLSTSLVAAPLVGRLLPSVNDGGSGADESPSATERRRLRHAKHERRRSKTHRHRRRRRRRGERGTSAERKPTRVVVLDDEDQAELARAREEANASAVVATQHDDVDDISDNELRELYRRVEAEELAFLRLLEEEQSCSKSAGPIRRGKTTGSGDKVGDDDVEAEEREGEKEEEDRQRDAVNDRNGDGDSGLTQYRRAESPLSGAHDNAATDREKERRELQRMMRKAQSTKLWRGPVRKKSISSFLDKVRARAAVIPSSMRSDDIVPPSRDEKRPSLASASDEDEIVIDFESHSDSNNAPSHFSRHDLTRLGLARAGFEQPRDELRRDRALRPMRDEARERRTRLQVAELRKARVEAEREAEARAHAGGDHTNSGVDDDEEEEAEFTDDSMSGSSFYSGSSFSSGDSSADEHMRDDGELAPLEDEREVRIAADSETHDLVVDVDQAEEQQQREENRVELKEEGKKDEEVEEEDEELVLDDDDLVPFNQSILVRRRLRAEREERRKLRVKLGVDTMAEDEAHVSGESDGELVDEDRDDEQALLAAGIRLEDADKDDEELVSHKRHIRGDEAAARRAHVRQVDEEDDELLETLKAAIAPELDDDGPQRKRKRLYELEAASKRRAVLTAGPTLGEGLCTLRELLNGRTADTIDPDALSDSDKEEDDDAGEKEKASVDEKTDASDASDPSHSASSAGSPESLSLVPLHESTLVAPEVDSSERTRESRVARERERAEKREFVRRLRLEDTRSMSREELEYDEDDSHILRKVRRTNVVGESHGAPTDGSAPPLTVSTLVSSLRSSFSTNSLPSVREDDVVGLLSSGSSASSTTPPPSTCHSREGTRVELRRAISSPSVKDLAGTSNQSLRRTTTVVANKQEQQQQQQQQQQQPLDRALRKSASFILQNTGRLLQLRRSHLARQANKTRSVVFRDDSASLPAGGVEGDSGGAGESTLPGSGEGSLSISSVASLARTSSSIVADRTRSTTNTANGATTTSPNGKGPAMRRTRSLFGALTRNDRFQ